jgi:hypothetical protein
MQQVGLYFFGRVGGGVAPVMLGHASDGLDVCLLGALCKASLHHGVYHALSQFGHVVSPSVRGNIPQTKGFTSDLHCASHCAHKKAVAACEDLPPRQRFSSTIDISRNFAG